MQHLNQQFRSETFSAPGQVFEHCTFENCHLNFDEVTILDCRLRHCTIHYSGRSVTINGMDAAHCVVALEGDLLRGIQSMAAMFGMEELMRMLSGMSASGRSSTLN